MQIYVMHQNNNGIETKGSGGVIWTPAPNVTTLNVEIFTVSKISF